MGIRSERPVAPNQGLPEHIPIHLPRFRDTAYTSTSSASAPLFSSRKQTTAPRCSYRNCRQWSLPSLIEPGHLMVRGRASRMTKKRVTMRMVRTNTRTSISAIVGILLLTVATAGMLGTSDVLKALFRWQVFTNSFTGGTDCRMKIPTFAHLGSTLAGGINAQLMMVMR
ncbi:hypothetical protein CKAH01_16570 [Colletotrichum kahawae]|uniref:Uncharacterized protein n=1 Tax=Colletotrichum kahawae TaxID=34407 RepID=A0AAD9YF62_COLKA|nr:hypothetical protein CKAH01_16570 [Colletotrichum kahawae]